MKKITILLTLAFIFYSGLTSYSQDLPYQQGLEPESLTPEELFVLSNIPLLELPESYKGTDAPLLPSSIDNSTWPYFRPITQQSGYECGQSSGIAFNFTYEIDRKRSLPANVGANQYPTHFTWDFLNNANNYQGASFFDSWEIVKACGNMNVTDYGGGLNTGGYTRWISGYDVYYNGMHNRLNSVKAIRVDTPEGLQTLKYWLFDHLEGAAVGGVGNIYGQYFGPPVATLPAGTPEAGKYVQTFWGGSPSHGWTICGYNDSIRYDFNGDGLYTNSIDINNDGVVDMHDWEKGGLKFANGYAGTGWCNSGFCYTMYKNLADNMGYGGIWNHTVYVLDVKSTCTPKLTMKVTLKHTSRNKLKVTAGLNTDLAATMPSYVLEFPIFNYQGADHYMQGGTTEADKTIEFGLDLAPLINQISSNQPAKYFLQVQEVDPSGAASGEIVNWSLIDYTSTPAITTTYPGSNIAIQNNTITRLGQTYNLIIGKPSITNASLPPAQLYQPYNHTLNASGGTPPYLWDAKLDYPETTAPAAFPAVTAQQLTLTNNNSGYVIKTIGFNFPFYKKSVNKLYIYADGYIMFDDQPFTWPYLIDKMLLFKQTSILSPFMTDMTIYPSASQGVWYEGNANYAIIRWKASITGMQSSTNLNFAVKLYPNGTIEYYYGDMTFPAGTSWTGGLSSGDNKNFQFSIFNNLPVTPNTLDKFSTCGFPPEMQISEDGHFTGTPTYSYQNLPIKFIVTDNDNISSTKVLLFNSFGLLVNQTITAGVDSLIEFGEMANITLNINNVGTQPMSLLNFSISESDPYITLVDSIESLPSIAGGQTLTLTNAFAFQVSPAVPDNHEFTIILQVQSQNQTFQRPIDLIAHAPVFLVSGTLFADGDNGMPDPGESADLLVTFKNAGSAKASSINCVLTSLDTNLVFTVNSANITQLKPDSSKTLTYHATAGSSAPFEHIYEIKSDLTANNNFAITDTLYMFSGQIVEDFETGNFEKFPWFHTGQWPWFMEQGVKYEGNYSTRSGVITDNAESILNLSAKVLADGEISFYKYVSCELDPSGSKGYDYMAFYIDNYEMGKWDGIIPWSKETFPVTAGIHRFTWVFHKDYSVAAGWDGCLLDFITFPLIEGLVPELSVSPPSIEKSIVTGQSGTESVFITNQGGGILKYSVMVFDTTANKKDIQPDNLTGSSVTCGSDGFVPGQAFNWTFTVQNQSNDAEYIRHIRFDFPPGVEVTGATNFSGGSLGEFTFLGSPGNGVSLNWHGESAGGRGVLKPGESAYATVTGNITESFVNDVFIVYQLGGDSLGTLPHVLPGHVKINNFGLANAWVALTNPTGSLMNGQTGTVGVNLDATSLVPGVYRCSLVARDLYNNRKVIPVTLQVTFPVEIGEHNAADVTRLQGCYPNPFAGSTQIRFDLSTAREVTLEIYNMQGKLVRAWKPTMMQSGQHLQTWDGTDGQGTQLSAGVYTCRVKAGDFTGSLKLILMR